MKSQEKKGKKESALKLALRALKAVMEYPLNPKQIAGDSGL